MSHFADRCACIRCVQYLEVLTQGYIDEDNIGRDWRVRDILATQLGPLCDILELSDIQETLEPTFFNFAIDPVANVRNSAHQATGQLLLRYQREGGDLALRDNVVRLIVALVDSDQYLERQIFVQICEKLLVAEKTCVCFSLCVILPCLVACVSVALSLNSQLRWPCCSNTQDPRVHGTAGIIFPWTSLWPVRRAGGERQACGGAAVLDCFQRT